MMNFRPQHEPPAVIQRFCHLVTSIIKWKKCHIFSTYSGTQRRCEARCFAFETYFHTSATLRVCSTCAKIKYKIIQRQWNERRYLMIWQHIFSIQTSTQHCIIAENTSHKESAEKKKLLILSKCLVWLDQSTNNDLLVRCRSICCF